MQVAGPHSSQIASSSEMRRIRQGSAQFEAMLLNEMLSKLRSSFCDSQDGDATDPSSDTLTSLSVEALSSALAARGGIGLGHMMVRALTQKTAQASPAIADKKAEGL